MISYTRYSDISVVLKENWNRFITEHPNGNVFQTPVMVSFFEKVKNYTPALTIVADENGEVLGVMVGAIQMEGKGIMGMLSSRCIVWGGPIVLDNRIDILEKLLSDFVSMVKSKTIYIQFRNLFDTNPLKEILELHGFKYEEHLNFINTLDAPDAFVKRFNKTKQYQVKKGLETDALICNPSDEKDIDDFYDLLYDLYINKVKKPLSDKSFFLNAFSYLTPQNAAFIKLIKVDNKVAGGILCFKDQRFVYDMYMVGMDKEYKKVSPTVLAIYAALKEGYDLSIPAFDFMGAGKPDEDYGVREFKGMFGGELVNFGRYEKITKPLLYKIGVLGVKIKGKLKL